VRSWSLALSVPAPDLADRVPLFLRIARAITDDVRRGRLHPGDPLPGSRELSRALGVHRNTVLAAYRELVTEGWLTAEAARGTFVSAALPDLAPRRFAHSAAPRDEVPSRVGFDLPPAERTALDPVFAPRGSGVLSLMGGVPDVRLAPAAALARAFRRSLRTSGRALLSYGDPMGPERLRDGLARMLSATRGLAASAETVLVTRGSQMALDLLARALLAPGDAVAVESLGYRPAWEAFRGAGARLVPLPLDDGGIDVRALAELTSTTRLRAVYVTPHHQYPTTVTLAAGRRLELLELARRERFAILEDDYDHEFHYDGRPVLPIASADQSGVVVYVGTLSKVLAPGLRIGYVVAPRPVVERMVAKRRYTDRQGDLVVEHAVGELLEDGEIGRHVRRARRAYLERRGVLVDGLRQRFGAVLSFTTPAGGTAIWARVAPEVSPEAWAARALERGVVLQTARTFAFDGRPRPYVRLGFAQLSPAELREALKRLEAALEM
jgi:GntR family transcriptional regulator/MocR family aminotransferase